ncbi:short chain dehydrogenase [Variovorax boronicumulans]|uniref:hypothetical protein n=1 Tax=Variovorax boronicumulans TaxID=436515 RepID=UPI000BB31805|nr:hypothetical protein [Variovorax boronicumulans]PBI89297.1 short chain dehydrogenase [Variovorax boronicumulans]
MHYAEDYKQGCCPRIVADSSKRIFSKYSMAFNGQCLIDDSFLRGEGITDFGAYAVPPRGIALAEAILME